GVTAAATMTERPARRRPATGEATAMSRTLTNANLPAADCPFGRPLAPPFPQGGAFFFLTAS
ncbi:MAG: hypothetical protein ACM3H9_04275, partial [Rhodospirillaceae bacterium]